MKKRIRPSLYPNRTAWLKSGNITKECLEALWNQSGGICHYCVEPVRKPNWFAPSTMRGFDHVKPMQAGGTNTCDNLVVCCWPCNTTKGNQYPYDPQTPRNKAKRAELAGVVPYWLGKTGPNKNVPHDRMSEAGRKAQSARAIAMWVAATGRSTKLSTKEAA